MFLKEEFLKAEKRYLISYLNAHYDFCYLSAMHRLQAMEGAEVVITGSSHGLDAINADKMSVKAINLSMHTQDLYYDYLNAKKAVEANTNIKVIVETFGYYNLCYDMSRTSYNYRCYEVYEPLFNDVHNANNSDCAERFIAPTKEETDFYSSYFLSYRNYYGPAVLREHTNGEVRKQGGWSRLSPSQRVELARRRTEKHNKHFKYVDTFNENCEIIKRYAKMCNDKQIRFVIAIMPFTEEYLSMIDDKYQKQLMEVLEELPYEVEYIDLNETKCFVTDDFIDSDHVNDKGADKVTAIIEQLLVDGGL